MRGGNGFIEDWPDARILRDVYVHAIWEGSGNVIALDVQRAIEHGALPGYLGDTERRAEIVSAGGPCAPLGGVIIDELQRIEGRLRALCAPSTIRTARQLPAAAYRARMATLAIGARSRRAGESVRRRHRAAGGSAGSRRAISAASAASPRSRRSPTTHRGCRTPTRCCTAARAGCACCERSAARGSRAPRARGSDSRLRANATSSAFRPRRYRAQPDRPSRSGRQDQR